MNPLIKKEIRLLLPAWSAATALVMLLPWVLPEDEVATGFYPAIVFVAGIILAVDAFGREFSLGMFQSFMAQPMERREWWRVKMKRLALGAVALFVGFCASNALKLWASVQTQPEAQAHLQAQFVGGILLLVGLAGGLWTSLLFRQISIAFWVSLVLPPLIVTVMMLVIPDSLAANTNFMTGLLVILALGYSYAGYKLAHRLFMRAQDVAWTGGVINLSRWQYFERSRPAAESHRRFQPLAASFKKELQLQSVSFICAGVLLALHLAVLMMRWVHGEFYVNSIAGVISESYWALWLVMPFLLGGTAIAEERKLNVTDGQFCLPLARHKQFALKFLMTMVLGVILGGWMPCLIEYGSAVLGLANGPFSFHSGSGDSLREGLMVFSWLSAGLTLLSIFASSLARQFLQALGLAFVSGIGCIIYLLFLRKFGDGYTRLYSDAYGDYNISLDAFRPWSTPLVMTMAVPLLVLTFIWLAWRNYKQFHEYQRRVVWSVVGVIGTMVFIMAASAAVYHRVWEYCQPLEPAHGSAKFAIKRSPVFLDANWYNNILAVQLPDGRVWAQDVTEHTSLVAGRILFWRYLDSLSTIGGPADYISGSDWASMAVRRMGAGFLNRFPYSRGGGSEFKNVGVKSDGTLWVSKAVSTNAAVADELVQYGDETDWQQVAADDVDPQSVVLLKRNGTLWYWDVSTNAPYQIGSDTNWCEVVLKDRVLVKKTDGTIWGLLEEKRTGNQIKSVRKVSMVREVDYDRMRLSSNSGSVYGWVRPCVHEDGTLWRLPLQPVNVNVSRTQPIQLSSETNWLSVAAAGYSMIALRSDGTLWKWDDHPGHEFPLPSNTVSGPIRLGIHDDWVALGTLFDGDDGGERFAVALAADGSLWLWPHDDVIGNHPDRLLAVTRRPICLGNVLKASE